MCVLYCCELRIRDLNIDLVLNADSKPNNVREDMIELRIGSGR